jgi:hypothetical protein
VAVFVSEAHDFVFNRGTVSRPSAVDPTAIHGRLMKIGLDQIVCSRSGTGQVTGHLLPLHMHLNTAEMQTHRNEPKGRQTQTFNFDELLSKPACLSFPSLHAALDSFEFRQASREEGTPALTLCYEFWISVQSAVAAW